MSLLPTPDKYAAEVRTGFAALLDALGDTKRLLVEIRDELRNQNRHQ